MDSVEKHGTGDQSAHGNWAHASGYSRGNPFDKHPLVDSAEHQQMLDSFTPSETVVYNKGYSAGLTSNLPYQHSRDWHKMTFTANGGNWTVGEEKAFAYGHSLGKKERKMHDKLLRIDPKGTVRNLKPDMTLLKALREQIEAIKDTLEKREFSTAQREMSAEHGHALPDGSFPIESKQDLLNAIQAYGRAKDKEAAKAHIKRRAKDMGAEDLLPMAWG